jgi:hypothetical protein
MPHRAHPVAFLEEMSAAMPRGWSLELDGGILGVFGPDGRSRAGIGAAWLASVTLLREDAVDEAVPSIRSSRK